MAATAGSRLGDGSWACSDDVRGPCAVSDHAAAVAGGPVAGDAAAAAWGGVAVGEVGKVEGEGEGGGGGGGATAGSCEVGWEEGESEWEKDSTPLELTFEKKSLYHKNTGIYILMGERIRDYFERLGLTTAEAERLHTRYYVEYGLAIKGLVQHHKIDPVEYDRVVDGGLPLEQILKPDPELRRMLQEMEGARIWACTNAGLAHATRVLKILGVYDLFDGITYCDYSEPEFVCKPATEFYVKAMREAEVEHAEDCFFADDSGANVDAAKKLGWTSVHVADTLPSKFGHFQITDIKDLPKMPTSSYYYYSQHPQPQQQQQGQAPQHPYSYPPPPSIAYPPPPTIVYPPHQHSSQQQQQTQPQQQPTSSSSTQSRHHPHASHVASHYQPGLPSGGGGSQAYGGGQTSQQDPHSATAAAYLYQSWSSSGTQGPTQGSASAPAEDLYFGLDATSSAGASGPAYESTSTTGASAVFNAAAVAAAINQVSHAHASPLNLSSPSLPYGSHATASSVSSNKRKRDDAGSAFPVASGLNSTLGSLNTSPFGPGYDASTSLPFDASPTATNTTPALPVSRTAPAPSNLPQINFPTTRFKETPATQSGKPKNSAAPASAEKKTEKQRGKHRQSVTRPSKRQHLDPAPPQQEVVVVDPSPPPPPAPAPVVQQRQAALAPSPRQERALEKERQVKAAAATAVALALVSAAAAATLSPTPPPLRNLPAPAIQPPPAVEAPAPVAPSTNTFLPVGRAAALAAKKKSREKAQRGTGKSGRGAKGSGTGAGKGGRRKKIPGCGELILNEEDGSPPPGFASLAASASGITSVVSAAAAIRPKDADAITAALSGPVVFAGASRRGPKPAPSVQAATAAIMEEQCFHCREVGSDRNAVVPCAHCERSWHQYCHRPYIHPDDDWDSWICHYCEEGLVGPPVDRPPPAVVPGGATGNIGRLLLPKSETLKAAAPLGPFSSAQTQSGRPAIPSVPAQTVPLLVAGGGKPDDKAFGRGRPWPEKRRSVGPPRGPGPADMDHPSVAFAYTEERDGEDAAAMNARWIDNQWCLACMAWMTDEDLPDAFVGEDGLETIRQLELHPGTFDDVYTVLFARLCNPCKLACKNRQSFLANLTKETLTLIVFQTTIRYPELASKLSSSLTPSRLVDLSLSRPSLLAQAAPRPPPPPPGASVMARYGSQGGSANATPSVRPSGEATAPAKGVADDVSKAADDSMLSERDGSVSRDGGVGGGAEDPGRGGESVGEAPSGSVSPRRPNEQGAVDVEMADVGGGEGELLDALGAASGSAGKRKAPSPAAVGAALRGVTLGSSLGPRQVEGQASKAFEDQVERALREAHEKSLAGDVPIAPIEKKPLNAFVNYEEMLSAAMKALDRPMGSPPKDLYDWMQAHIKDLPLTFRSSAAQALKKGLEKGHFLKPSFGQYAINPKYDEELGKRRSLGGAPFHGKSLAASPSPYVFPAAPATPPTPIGRGTVLVGAYGAKRDNVGTGLIGFVGDGVGAGTSSMWASPRAPGVGQPGAKTPSPMPRMGSFGARSATGQRPVAGVPRQPVQLASRASPGVGETEKGKENAPAGVPLPPPTAGLSQGPDAGLGEKGTGAESGGGQVRVEPVRGHDDEASDLLGPSQDSEGDGATRGDNVVGQVGSVTGQEEEEGLPDIEIDEYEQGGEGENGGEDEGEASLQDNQADALMGEAERDGVEVIDFEQEDLLGLDPPKSAPVRAAPESTARQEGGADTLADRDETMDESFGDITVDTLGDPEEAHPAASELGLEETSNVDEATAGLEGASLTAGASDGHQSDDHAEHLRLIARQALEDVVSVAPPAEQARREMEERRAQREQQQETGLRVGGDGPTATPEATEQPSEPLTTQSTEDPLLPENSSEAQLQLQQTNPPATGTADGSSVTHEAAAAAAAATAAAAVAFERPLSLQEVEERVRQARDEALRRQRELREQRQRELRDAREKEQEQRRAGALTAPSTMLQRPYSRPGMPGTVTLTPPSVVGLAGGAGARSMVGGGRMGVPQRFGSGGGFVASSGVGRLGGGGVVRGGSPRDDREKELLRARAMAEKEERERMRRQRWKNVPMVPHRRATAPVPGRQQQQQQQQQQQPVAGLGVSGAGGVPGRTVLESAAAGGSAGGDGGAGGQQQQQQPSGAEGDLQTQGRAAAEEDDGPEASSRAFSETSMAISMMGDLDHV
ncbi:hypothetical protein HDU96_010982 [Phlyctochytrium bullatum]|nr:hypothetical protein HDU96_010982 [Phlyctochytrium bullatum]